MYRSQYKCSDCNNRFERITKNFPKKDPNCPKCLQSKRVKSNSCVSDKTHNLDAESRVQEIIESKKAFSMGPSNFTKAMDATAEIVMKDYALTDLQDNLRAGDSMAPKLAPELERKVHEVFKPQKPIMGQGGAINLNKALTANINAGRYAGQNQIRDVAAQAQSFGQARTAATGNKVPTTEIFSYDNRGKPN